MEQTAQRSSVGSPLPQEMAGGSMEGVQQCRALLRSFVSHWTFTAMIYLVICYDTVLSAVDGITVERNPFSPIHPVMEISDWVILTIFTLEMVVKLVAFGPGKLSSCASVRSLLPTGSTQNENSSVRTHPPPGNQQTEERDDASGAGHGQEEQGAGVREAAAVDAGHSQPGFKGYFDSGWNLLDFAIVVGSWVLLPIQYLMTGNETVGRLMRIFRIGRPLRAFRFFDGTKDVLKTFPRAIPDIGDVLALLLFFFLVYAILGINLFGLEVRRHIILFHSFSPMILACTTCARSPARHVPMN
jgi:hypothetical protein